MPRITKVYTRTGDDGTTALGSKRRVAKDDPRVSAYGTVDELNSCIGVCLTLDLAPSLSAALRIVQNELFHLGADLCVPAEDRAPGASGPQLDQRHVVALEELIDRLNEELVPLANFVLPGGSPAAAHLHVARTVARRAERLIVALARAETVRAEGIRYLNRLSDALFVMARYQNNHDGVAEPLWDSRA